MANEEVLFSTLFCFALGGAISVNNVHGSLVFIDWHVLRDVGGGKR